VECLALNSYTLKALSAFCGTSYIWLISRALLNEFKQHSSPERTAELLTSWGSIFNMFRFFEIFLPLTQVHVLGNFQSQKSNGKLTIS